jgi:ribonuclease HII
MWHNKGIYSVLPSVMNSRPTFAFEDACEGRVAGVDEVGYGAWAGPVVVAAVVCRCTSQMPDFVNYVHDSKKMTPQQRNWVFDAFLAHSSWGYSVVDWVPVQAINTGCVLRLTLDAMARSAAAVDARHVLVDGCRGLPSSISHQCIQKGDQKSISIALASIVAKVVRDRWMERLAVDYPLFHWDQNKGYGTALHQRAIRHHGVTPHHRVGYCRRVLGRG